jgi:hypothetical protein
MMPMASASCCACPQIPHARPLGLAVCCNSRSQERCAHAMSSLAPRMFRQLIFSRAGSLHIDDVSVTQHHDPQPGLLVLHASDTFVDCAADRAAAASWLVKKDFQAPPPPPHSSCMQVLHHALKLGDRDVGNADKMDITLALQLSIDRLENIKTLLSVWDGEPTLSAIITSTSTIRSCSMCRADSALRMYRRRCPCTRVVSGHRKASFVSRQRYL